MRPFGRLLPVLFVLASAASALAGGGPETTLVVVNAGSPLSRAVANEYVARRGIPESHVVHLDGIPHVGVVDLEFFRTKILAPIEQAIAERGLEDAVDLVTYSADFPYAVNFRKVLPNPNPGHQVGGVASLTGVTYLAPHVTAGEEFWNLQINPYFRLDAAKMPRYRAPTPAENQALLQAQAALAAKNQQAAAEAFGRAVATYDVHPDVWYNFACCLAQTGRADEALAALLKAAERGFLNANHARFDADLKPISGDPRFDAAIERMLENELPFLGAEGFRSRGGSGGGRYRLSTMLAYTGPRGNSLPEIRRYLEAAAGADGVRPDGTVYICMNGDVRSTSRGLFFGSMLQGLARLDRKAEVLVPGAAGQNGVVPKDRADVMGAVIGAAGSDWDKSGSRLLPGAIAESLTSFGAFFDTPGQTKLTEFLRHGAAGASGTVIEPLSIWMKFPAPQLHVFYAEGSSLAEAFFQSTWGPYQLLVAGDGLSRPFARFAAVDPAAPAGPWTGAVEFAPKAEGAASFELFVDGRLAASGTDLLRFDAGAATPGWHDVRVVAIGPSPIATRSDARLLVATTGGGEVRPDAEIRGGPEFAFDAEIEVRAREAKRIEVYCQGRLVAASDGPAAKLPAALVGPGPVVLQPVLRYADGATWRAKPLEVRVAEPALRKAAEPAGESRAGLLATIEDDGTAAGALLPATEDRTGNAALKLAAAAVPGGRIVVSGEFQAPAAGFHRLLATGRGAARIAIDGETVAEESPLEEGVWLPLGLEAGWHSIRIEIAPGGSPDVGLLLGGPTVSAPPALRSAAPAAHPDAPEIEGAPKDGAAGEIPAEGLLLRFKRAVKDVAGVRLTLPEGATACPAAWVVESRSAATGAFREAKEVRAILVPGPKGTIAAVEILFPPLRARDLRLRPATPPATPLPYTAATPLAAD